MIVNIKEWMAPLFKKTIWGKDKGEEQGGKRKEKKTRGKGTESDNILASGFFFYLHLRQASNFITCMGNSPGLHSTTQYFTDKY